MTNEDFEAMIPQRFLKNIRNQTEEPVAVVTTLTIKKPCNLNGIEFRESPTSLGQVTETITKSTFTETVVTRVTDNKLAKSVIIEVSKSIVNQTIIINYILNLVVEYNFTFHFCILYEGMILKLINI